MATEGLTYASARENGLQASLVVDICPINEIIARALFTRPAGPGNSVSCASPGLMATCVIRDSHGHLDNYSSGSLRLS